MAERLFLHIGAPKTGTTYLQGVLDTNRSALRAAGVLYPSVGGEAHHTAYWDLRSMWERRDFGRDVRGDWNRTVALVDAFSGTAVLSSELFVYAGAADCRRALGGFADGTEVHVVYTARDLVRQAPAVWQERIKNQYTLGYQEFLADVVGKSSTSMAQSFWRAQDLPTALKRWSQGVPSTRVHVVTTPATGSPPALLWERFAGVIGVDGRQYDSDVHAVNTSMSVLAAEVLRRFNVRHGKSLTLLEYRRTVRGGLFEVLTEVAQGQSTLSLTSGQQEALTERARHIADVVRERGYDVAGDLDDLVPAAPGRSTRKLDGRQPEAIGDHEIVEALLDVVNELLWTQRRLNQRPAKQAKGRSGTRRGPARARRRGGRPGRR